MWHYSAPLLWGDSIDSLISCCYSSSAHFNAWEHVLNFSVYHRWLRTWISDSLWQIWFVCGHVHDIQVYICHATFWFNFFMYLCIYLFIERAPVSNFSFSWKYCIFTQHQCCIYLIKHTEKLIWWNIKRFLFNFFFLCNVFLWWQS